MTTKYKQVLGSVFVTLLMTACSSDDDASTAAVDTTVEGSTVVESTNSEATTDENSENQDSATENTENEDSTNEDVAVENSVLEGLWQLSCNLDSELPPGIDNPYTRSSLTFSGGTSGDYENTYSQHNSADCTDTTGSGGTVTGAYTIGSELTSSGGLAVTQLDIMRDALTLLGQETISPLDDQPLVLTIIYIDGETLYVGIEDDPDANPPVRSTTLDFNTPFLKQ